MYLDHNIGVDGGGSWKDSGDVNDLQFMQSERICFNGLQPFNGMQLVSSVDDSQFM